MQSRLSPKSKSKLKLFGWYQIIGGVAGLLITVWILAHTQQLNGLVLILFLIAFGLYGFSTYCGRLLLNDNYLKGLNLSVINQALQILHFAMLGYAFLYIAGLKLEIGLSTGHVGIQFNFDFGLLSTWQLSVNSEDRSFILAVNLVAIYWLYYIEKLKIALNKELADHKESEMDNSQNAGEVGRNDIPAIE